MVEPAELMMLKRMVYVATGEVDEFESWMPEPSEIVGSFLVHEEIGRGTFGRVFRATDRLLMRNVALKVPRIVGLDQKHVQALIQEARTAAQLRHPNIVSVYEVHWSEHKIFIVADFISGRSLDEMNSLDRFSPVDAAKLTAKLAYAIHYAHCQGIIHRDLRPANVIIDEFGEPHITDFGVALRDFCGHSFPESESLPPKLSEYTAPEHAFTREANVDPRLDVYSLGSILYQLLYGPGQNGKASNGANGYRESNGEIRVPHELQSICKKAIEIKVSDRYATAEDFARDLDRFVQRETETEVESQTRWPFTKLVLAGVASIALLLSLTYFLGQSPDPEDVSFRVVPDLETDVAEIEKISIRRANEVGGPGLLESRQVAEIVPNEELTFSLPLAAGLYYVDIEKTDGSKFTVSRTVPTEADRVGYPVRTDGAPLDWTLDQANPVRLRDIEFHDVLPNDDGSFSLGSETMVRIDEGDFDFGSEFFRDPLTGESLYPLHSVHVAAFYVSRFEVTTGDYLEVMGDLPEAMKRRFNAAVPPDIPVTNVSFDQARLYCERVGGRLPTLVEYMFVASNRGTTKFPWGDTPPELQQQNGQFAIDNDQTLIEPIVYGLYNSVKEWTQDINVPYVFQDQVNNLPDDIKRLAMQSRISVGGDLSDLQSQDPERIASMPGVRHFESGSLNQDPGPYQGFRVYR